MQNHHIPQKWGLRVNRGKPGFLMRLFGFPAHAMPLNGLAGAVIAALMSSVVYLLVRVLKGVHPMVFVRPGVY